LLVFGLNTILVSYLYFGVYIGRRVPYLKKGADKSFNLFN